MQNIFKRCAAEGGYEILVHHHLFCNEENVKEYFCLTPVLFGYVLNYIKYGLTSNPDNRNKNPTDPKTKTCIFLST